MAIQKLSLLHFVNFLHQSLMLADNARCFPRLRPPGIAKTDRSSALPNIFLSDINLSICSSDQ